ncbi:MFS alpha-glucoside transporter-like protein [Lophiostoma macrostomum CBS 122681]|uniref:MFS alpha-glucoside transporter-like protein n=1 Tax=Lophiostoma macrostomum CBS 122681 TaxID=1314788 RepID=A0A6A6TFT5_9PLEO|nr:MFS alpha-glucoside transporter-like protein [Lophiostoma macrostomum CBS 122681]
MDASHRSNSIVHVDTEQVRKMSATVPDFVGLTEDAARATKSEQSMTLMQALRLYPKAAGWSILLSTAIIMEGFDNNLITNLLAVPAFKQRFGEQLPNGDYEVTAAWQAGLSNGALVGEMLGLMINGIIAERFGFKKTMIGALALVTGIIFIVFFVQSIEMLLVGLILIGIPWGVFQTLTTTYAAEVTPVVLRPYLTTYVNLCWVMGQFLASGVLKGTSERPDQWAYRIPYALQWVWPVPLIVGIYLAPESPWWLVRKERYDDAKKVLLRLTSRNSATNFDANQTISMMKHTNELEKSITVGTSYMDCFKGTDLRRTEIVCMTWFTQAFCGSSFMGFSTYFFIQAGLDTANAFSMSLGQYAIGFLGVLVSWYLMTRCGRRTLYVWGQVAMCAILLLIGFLGIAPKDNAAVQWCIGGALLLFTFIYDSTVGPVCYSLVAEMPSTRLRQKSVVLARNFYNLASIVSNILTPRMLNPGAWAWGAKSGFFFAGTCFACLVWTYFRLPEPKGRTYGELDVLFEQRTSARKFAGTVVEELDVGVGADAVDAEKKRVRAHLEAVESNN